MLPTIEIARTEVFLMERDFSVLFRPESIQRSGEGGPVPYSIVCHSYFFDLGLRDAAVEAGMNLDRFLTRHIVGHLYAKPLKSKLLFLYLPFGHGMRVMVCDRRARADCGWLGKLKGYREYGREYVNPRSTPLIYWDGSRACRVYPEPPAEGKRYVLDLGQLVGAYIAPATVQDWRRIARDPAEYWDYTAVPVEPEETLEVAGRQFPLSHAFFRLV